MKRKSESPADITLTGRLLHYNFSPKGAVEGLIVEGPGGVAQVVVDKHQRDAVAAAVAEGQPVKLRVAAAAPSDKGQAAHPVYDLLDVPTSDQLAPSPADGASGVVARLNYAKHGEANGVVLDTGDFVHLKPGGMKRAKLKVGDRVEASGPSRPMDRGGRVVEAETVNGKPVER